MSACVRKFVRKCRLWMTLTDEVWADSNTQRVFFSMLPFWITIITFPCCQNKLGRLHFYVILVYLWNKFITALIGSFPFVSFFFNCRVFVQFDSYKHTQWLLRRITKNVFHTQLSCWMLLRNVILRKDKIGIFYKSRGFPDKHLATLFLWCTFIFYNGI